MPGVDVAVGLISGVTVGVGLGDGVGVAVGVAVFGAGISGEDRSAVFSTIGTYRVWSRSVI